MASSVYQIIPLRRVPARFSVLDYDLASTARAPSLGEIVEIPFGKTKISGVVWAKGKSSLLQTFTRKTFQTKAGSRFFTSQQCALVTWLAKETLTSLPVIAMGMLPTTAKNRQKMYTGGQHGILAGHLDERSRVIQQFARQQASSGTTVVFIPALAYAHTWEEHFGNTCTVVHGKLNDKQKLALLAKAPRIIVTTQIGLTLPWHDLRHIVLDQADDDGYFAFDQAPRVDVRRAVQQLAKVSGAALTLIARWQSPTLEGLFPHLQWRGQTAAAWTIIDRTGENGEQRRSPVASGLLERITIGRTLWLVHRRSAAGQLRCADCDAVVVCPKCGLPMHVVTDGLVQILVCKRDNLRQMQPDACPTCKGVHFNAQGKGIGTIANELRLLIGDDVDVVDAKQKPRNATTQHVVSTTAIANYLEQQFDRVIVVRTESFFAPGQYRGAEELHQALAIARQHVNRQGEFFCQTFQPETAEFQDDQAVSTRDVTSRRNLHYPPFGLLLLLQPRPKTSRVSPAPLTDEVFSRLPNVRPLGKRWMIRCSAKDRASLLETLREHLDDTWEALVDPPRIPQD